MKNYVPQKSTTAKIQEVWLLLMEEEILHHLGSPKSWELHYSLGPLGGAKIHPSTAWRAKSCKSNMASPVQFTFGHAVGSSSFTVSTLGNREVEPKTLIIVPFNMDLGIF